MTKIKKWSKEVNLDETAVNSNFGNELSLGKAMQWLEWLRDGLDGCIYWIKEGSRPRALDFTVEPEFDEFGLDYNGGGFSNLHNKLVELTDSGYDVRQQWQDFQKHLSSIWKALPEYGDFMKSWNGTELEKPEDYDPDKPFPQYPIPEDIEE